MDLVAILALNVLSGGASLVLLCLGLAVIFGMMRIFNLAHGEFLMLGAYSTVVATQAGFNIWLSIFIITPVVVGLIGIVVERCLIRFLYGRTIDTMLATWGLSLLLSGLVATMFGNTMKSVPTPFGGFSIGAFRFSLYTLVLIVVAISLLIGSWTMLRYTRLGLIARATMQDRQMAAALGVDPSRVYMVAFGIGAALTGLAGGLFAPVLGVAPTMGAAYLAKAFITVVGGGAAIIAGTASASAIFGSINQLVSYWTTPIFGEVALLISAIILIRFVPQGLSACFFRRSL
ncbi:branched-chain amino acid ABC transporter permease [Bradyrhizobium manausense]